jgi:hypothetical protein
MPPSGNELFQLFHRYRLSETVHALMIGDGVIIIGFLIATRQ